MLTITFMSETLKTVVSCDSYDVENEDQIIIITACKGFGDAKQSETFEVSSVIKTAYDVAYVTNLAGKTIDRIGG